MDLISPELRLEFREFCVDLALRQIDAIFSMADIDPGEVPPGRNISGDRRTRVEEYYSSIDWANQVDADKFLVAIGLVLSQSYLSEPQKDIVRELCRKADLVVSRYKVLLPHETNAEEGLFKKQFPAGLPFGKVKPNFSIAAKKGGQSLSYELKSGGGLILDDVYPNFTFSAFQSACGIDPSTNVALKKSLMAMNQTANERLFFQSYAKHYKMAETNVPLLVPQAWIQWHSSTKRNLRETNASHADELHRVDFVAFWDNQRYAILVDDISHYAKKQDNKWIADEESYSNRLKEDRKLQAQGWRVFRVSNWEVREEVKLCNLLCDLGDVVGIEK